MRTKIRTKPIKLRYQFIIFFVLIILSCLDIRTSQAGQAEQGIEYELFVGLGMHSERYDCPEVCYGGDELAIVQFTVKAKDLPFAVQAIHISNPTIRERGYGTNAVFGGLYFNW